LSEKYKLLKNNRKISTLTDDELLGWYIQSNDALYFGELYKRYIPKVYGLCLRYLNDTETARDAVMDIYQQLITKVLQYKITNFNAWLYSVAKNHCLHIIRKGESTTFIKIDDAFVENEDIFTLFDVNSTKEETDALEHCMTTLSDEQKICISLFYYEEQSYADISESTGYETGKVKSYIQNGKRNLKICILKVLDKNWKR